MPYNAKLVISDTPHEFAQELIERTYADVMRSQGFRDALNREFQWVCQLELNKYRRDVN